MLFLFSLTCLVKVTASFKHTHTHIYHSLSLTHWLSISISSHLSLAFWPFYFNYTLLSYFKLHTCPYITTSSTRNHTHFVTVQYSNISFTTHKYCFSTYYHKLSYKCFLLSFTITNIHTHKYTPKNTFCHLEFQCVYECVRVVGYTCRTYTHKHAFILSLCHPHFFPKYVYYSKGHLHNHIFPICLIIILQLFKIKIKLSVNYSFSLLHSDLKIKQLFSLIVLAKQVFGL
jgi:hypothetical protein